MPCSIPLQELVSTPDRRCAKHGSSGMADRLGLTQTKKRLHTGNAAGAALHQLCWFDATKADTLIGRQLLCGRRPQAGRQAGGKVWHPSPDDGVARAPCMTSGASQRGFMAAMLVPWLLSSRIFDKLKSAARNGAGGGGSALLLHLVQCTAWASRAAQGQAGSPAG